MNHLQALAINQTLRIIAVAAIRRVSADASLHSQLGELVARRDALTVEGKTLAAKWQAAAPVNAKAISDFYGLFDDAGRTRIGNTRERGRDCDDEEEDAAIDAGAALYALGGDVFTSKRPSCGECGFTVRVDGSCGWCE